MAKPMNPRQHDYMKCQNREKCVGPGCKINTGKTRRDRIDNTDTRHKQPTGKRP